MLSNGNFIYMCSLDVSEIIHLNQRGLYISDMQLYDATRYIVMINQLRLYQNEETFVYFILLSILSVIFITIISYYCLIIINNFIFYLIGDNFAISFYLHLDKFQILLVMKQLNLAQIFPFCKLRSAKVKMINKMIELIR